MPPSSFPNQIAGFRILKEIGRGRMGIVYLAEDLHIPRQVAIKILREEMVNDVVAKKRFFLEGQVLAVLEGIHSDHVVKLLMICEANGIPYLVMEYLEGESLQRYLDSRKKWSISRLFGFADEWSVSRMLGFAKEFAKGLADIHETGFIHRDIKPEHLFLQAPDGRVKIIDFGTAKPIEPSTNSRNPSSIQGTLGYMSLEHIQGRSIDHRADIFSAGVVLYQLCTRRLPYEGDTIPEMIQALTHTIPLSVSSQNSKIPKPFSDLIDQMITRYPDSRPASMKDVLTKLDGISA